MTALEPVTSATDQAPSTAQVCFRLLRNDPAAYALAWFQWVGFHMTPIVVGWVLKLVLDHLTAGRGGVPWLLLGALLGTEAARWTLMVSAAVQWHGAYIGWLTVPRVNALSSLATAPGPASARLPGSPGEAVSRFRDDAQDLGTVLDVWLDVSGAVLSAAVALAIMFAIAPLAAASTAIPVGIALVLSTALGPRLRHWRRAARQATSQVTSFIGDTFGAVLAVKTGGAESAVDDRFAALNAQRARLSRRDQLGSELIRSLGYGTGEITVGVVLLLVASAFRRGDLSVGDIALFASYVTVVAGLPKWVGRLGAYQRQADVSVDRLAELMPDRARLAPVAPVQTHLRHGPPPLDSPPAATVDFAELRVEGLTVRHTDAGRGIEEVDVVVRAGERVVVTGKVGSGKSTLLRGLLGLVPVSAGRILWNNEEVVDPSMFLIPPRVAYLPQVPRLFSERLADTILLGRTVDGLEHALWLACMDDDLEHMPDGVDTLIGPRGLRLSGGQTQRTGAARALVRRPALLVVDDLSSALDVETEIELWHRLTEQGPAAALMVSHRAHVLDTADRVVYLEEGRVSRVENRA